MPTPCWLKHLCSIRTWSPCLAFSLSLSLSLRLFLWSAEALWVHFPDWASKTLLRRRSVPSPHREGAWGLREQSKPHAGPLLAFCINQGISASFSLLYFLIGRLQTTRFRSIKGLQHSISPSNKYLSLISFRIDWFDLLAVQGTLKSLLQYHS